MGRLIGSVVLGYVVLFAAVITMMSVAYLILGANGAFQPGSWDISGLWIAVSIVVGLVAGVGGGYVCAAVARDPRGPLWLVGVIIVLGLAIAIPVLTGGGEAAELGPRPETVPMFDAMSSAVQPAWVAFLNPVLGAIGVFFGTRLQGMRSA